MTDRAHPIGPIAFLLRAVGLIDLTDAACGPPVDPETFFGTERVRLAIHICHDHCPIRRECQEMATEWSHKGFFREPTIMGGRLWGSGSRKNFYTVPGSGVCPICQADHSANVHLGPSIPKRKKKADDDTTPHPDTRPTDQEPGGVG